MADNDTEIQQKWPDRLVIIRHGQSGRNVAKDQARINGSHTFGTGLRDVDTPLTHEGHQQAKETGAHLASTFSFDVAFTSPYKRTIETTAGLLSASDPKPRVVLEERIREIEFGILDGLTKNGIQQRYPEEFERRTREGKYWYRPPGGESDQTWLCAFTVSLAP